MGQLDKLDKVYYDGSALLAGSLCSITEDTVMFGGITLERLRMRVELKIRWGSMSDGWHEEIGALIARDGEEEEPAEKEEDDDKDGEEDLDDLDDEDFDDEDFDDEDFDDEDFDDEDFDDEDDEDDDEDEDEDEDE